MSVKELQIGSGFFSLIPVIPGGLFCDILHNSCLLTSTPFHEWNKFFAVLTLKMLSKFPMLFKKLQFKSFTAEWADSTRSISVTGKVFHNAGEEKLNATCKLQSKQCCYSRFLLMFVYTLLILWLPPVENLKKFCKYWWIQPQLRKWESTVIPILQKRNWSVFENQDLEVIIWILSMRAKETCCVFTQILVLSHQIPLHYRW